ncbi:sugar phosphate isomerase/epimerase [Lewinella marina]|uniref:Sugar phosphate isomerase n=1 Tax=Neolewinella marina TaxID=438751 RepID=A0A2G0CKJ5_9BACT|nr:sugar phosphate isomerase/epimerase [Neolewinella marina]NJB84300.1 sugar phosphate isomerase/epimerase [Neolewinella marina]PHL00494.1 sugar phosphate isomerase [Neolewinella marina]
MIRSISFLLGFVLLFGLVACGGTREETDTAGATAVPESANQFGGLALYTLRDTLAKDPRTVLREVADLGYAYIEAAGYSDGKFYGMSPTEFKNYLAEVGLKPVSSHHGDVTRDNADEMIAAAKEAGFQYFVIPVPPEGRFQFDPATRTLGMNGTVAEASDIINEIAAKAAAQGMQTLYHNHDFEFVANDEGIVPIDYFIENSNPDHLNFQMDLYWVTKAGADPVDYFNRYPGRFKAWHVKDIDAQGRFAPVGTGSIDFARILAEKEKSGMEFYLVEQDMTFDETPLEAIEISHAALEEIGFE